MGTFITELQRRNLEYVIQGNAFKKLVPNNTDKLADLVERIVRDNLWVYIDPDCDPDGYFAALIVKRMFDYLNYTNYVVGEHDVKRHNIRQSFITNLLMQSYDVFIIVDSSTNNMDMINLIVESGKEIAIIDHHTTSFRIKDYPDKSVVINPQLDAHERPVIYDKLSAGAICALVCDYILSTRFKHQSNQELYIYGFITLYSDCCDMSNAYNIAYIRRFQNLELLGSDLIQMFWNQYTHFDRNFVSWRLVPRINALVRTEHFDMLHQMFFNFDTIKNPYEFADRVEEIYQSCREYANELVTRCSLTQHKHYSVAMLPEDVERKAHNFTGQVANHFAGELNQAVLCLYAGSPTKYNGSVRDAFSRNIISIFQPLCSAEGHGPAFGVEIEKNSLPSVLNMLDSLDDLFTESQQNVILIPWDGRNYNEVLEEQRLMAEYNEFGGAGLPKVLGVIKIQKDWRIFRKPKYIDVYGNHMKFRGFVTTADVGDTLLVAPTLNGADIKLLIENVSFAD